MPGLHGVGGGGIFCDQILFHRKSSFLVTNYAILYNVFNVKPQLYAKGLVWSRGWEHFSKHFSISYILNGKKVFSTHIF